MTRSTTRRRRFRPGGSAARAHGTADGAIARSGTAHATHARSTSEPTIGLPAVATVPIESRRLFERVDARLLSAAPAATMNGLPLPASPDRASGQARATSSLAGARDAASAVASGAERGGVAIGRAFARAGQAIAGKF